MAATREGQLITLSEAREEDEDEKDKDQDQAEEAVTLSNAGGDNERTGVGSSIVVKEGETVKEAVSVGGQRRGQRHGAARRGVCGRQRQAGPKADVGHDAVSVGGSLDIDPRPRSAAAASRWPGRADRLPVLQGPAPRGAA